MLRTIKPKNARSKRALDARLPKEVEDARTVVFANGTKTGQVLNGVMRDFMALKRPHAIAFSKKNDIHPFDAASTSIASLEFWAQKNDASMFVIAQTTKKRPNCLTFVRMFDYRVLDMLEVSVESCVGMPDIKTPKCTPGNKPLMHFASDLFDTNTRFAQLKSILISLFNGEVIDSICLTGLEHVISVSIGPSVPSADADPSSSANLPTVHLRTYTTKLLASGTHPELLKQAMQKPKLKKSDIESGLGKKRKNIEVDEMGDLRGRIHVGKQDLSKLQTRKMKGLKETAYEDKDEGEADEQEGPRKKRRREPASA
ncbi:Brix domain-containing protein [Mycena kentingensis (nom. inval.)]|nr:Brix domain-containing protein [Mycena kentingensis (nom. inval.)]